MTDSSQTKISIFRGKNIRNVVEALTETNRPRKYWNDLKTKLMKEGYIEVSEKIGQLKLKSPDGKLRETDCANTETMLRVVQAIPSPNAEPLKRWLARTGYERIQEIEDPELATKRARAIYMAKGYPDGWIKHRTRGIEARYELTDEWKGREVKLEREYAILTAEISKATFGMTPSQYKKFKNLKRGNLRDHMNEVELLFSMLGEVSTKEITRARNAKGLSENKRAAKEGGDIAGGARVALEKKTRKKVSTKTNYLKGYGEDKQISS
jgi:DNA-damage-inducible protein D